MQGRILILQMLIIYIRNAYSSSCSGVRVVTEGSTYTVRLFLHKSMVTNGKIRWEAWRPDGSVAIVTECDINNSPSCTRSPLFGEGTYSSTMEDDGGDDYRTALTIYDVRRYRDQATWSVMSGSEIAGQCLLGISSFKSDPECGKVRLTNDKNSVTWACTINEVYYSDHVDCRFVLLKDNQVVFEVYEASSQNLDVESATTKISDPPDVVHYDYTCKLINVLVSDLDGEGIYQSFFSVTINSGFNGFVGIDSKSEEQDLNLDLTKKDEYSTSLAPDTTKKDETSTSQAPDTTKKDETSTSQVPDTTKKDETSTSQAPDPTKKDKSSVSTPLYIGIGVSVGPLLGLITGFGIYLVCTRAHKKRWLQNQVGDKSMTSSQAGIDGQTCNETAHEHPKHEQPTHEKDPDYIGLSTNDIQGPSFGMDSGSSLGFGTIFSMASDEPGTHGHGPIPDEQNKEDKESSKS